MYLNPKKQNSYSFKHVGNITKTGHVLGCKIRVATSQGMNITQAKFSDHSAIQLKFYKAIVLKKFHMFGNNNNKKIQLKNAWV